LTYYAVIWAREDPYDFTRSVTTRYIHFFIPVQLVQDLEAQVGQPAGSPQLAT